MAGLSQSQLNRAGQYRKQQTGYRAFVPVNLPPNPPISINEDLLATLTKANYLLGRLDGSIQILPDSDLFVLMYIRKEAVLSSQIEGTQSSLQDLLAAEAKLFGSDAPPNDVDEIINYVAAMNYGLKRLDELPVSVRLIREIHKILLTGVRGGQWTPGELRTSQNWIGPSGCLLSEATFVPPPPHLIRQALGDLEKFIHNKDDIPELIKIGLAHAQFETIHPFLDGNGRIGRLLITFLLTERKLLQKPVLYLSHYFKRYRTQYYEHLQAVREEGDWEGWLKFFLIGVAEVSNEATENSRRILALREEHRSAIASNLGHVASNGLKVFESLYNKPIVSISEVETITGTSYTAANKLVNRLVDIGILKEMTGYKRNKRFRYEDYIRLFIEDDAVDQS